MNWAMEFPMHSLNTRDEVQDKQLCIWPNMEVCKTTCGSLQKHMWKTINCGDMFLFLVKHICSE